MVQVVDVKRLLDAEMEHEQQDLVRGLKDRHVQLIAIGGAIGVGLFLGSATAISRAGPGLVLAYAIGGLAVFFIMRALGELLMYRPVAGSFRHLCRGVRRPLGRVHHRLVVLVHVGGHGHGRDHRRRASTSITGSRTFRNGSRPWSRWACSTCQPDRGACLRRARVLVRLIKVVTIIAMLVIGLVVILFGVGEARPDGELRQSLVGSGGLLPDRRCSAWCWSCRS